MKKLLAVICLILAAIFALGAIGTLSTDPQTAAMGAVLAVVFLLLWRKLHRPKQTKSKAAPKGKATVQQSAGYQHIHIHVAGVTYRNDDGSDRQHLLRKIKFGDAPFADNDNLDVQLQSYRYKGEPAIRVLVNGSQIGNVPKEQVTEVQHALTQPGATISAFEVKGGGTVNGEKLNYGALVVLRYNV